MTEAEIYKQALLRELYRQSYYDFFVDAVSVLEPGTRWDFNWHHSYLCNLLQAVNIPPRRPKSLIASVVFNARVWATVDAGHSFPWISHTDELAIG